MEKKKYEYVVEEAQKQFESSEENIDEAKQLVQKETNTTFRKGDTVKLSGLGFSGSIRKRVGVIEDIIKKSGKTIYQVKITEGEYKGFIIFGQAGDMKKVSSK